MLAIRNIKKNFGGLKALKDVTMDVLPGTVHGIIGPNGSGKTTMFNCITGLLPLSGGKIYLDDREISCLPAHLIARQGIRRTFQQGKLVGSMTVLENVMAGADGFAPGESFQTIFRAPGTRSKSEDRFETQARRALEFLGLEKDAHRWAADLTWAERQYVQLARAIVSKPRVVLLDEPASGMGPVETDHVGVLIRRIRDDGTTVVVVSHDMKMLMETSDTVTVLCFGDKIAEGTPSEVQQNPRVVEAYLGSE